MKINEGGLDLQKDLEELIGKAENVEEVLEVGAKAFQQDLSKLAKPRSQIRAAKHTHMIDTFAYAPSKLTKGDYLVGWGKYYGRMVEKGTEFQSAQPHLEPMWNRNQDKYFDLMIKKLNL